MSADLKHLSLVVHGTPKIGKSWLGESSPGPVLVIDGEGSTDFLKRKKRQIWNPDQAPPAGLTPWDIVVVKASNWHTVMQVNQWLNSGQHEFNSLVIDTLTELQKKCKASIASTFDDQRQWGQLLEKMELTAKFWANLTDHPVKPLLSVVVLTQTVEKDKWQRPDVQGALTRSLGSFYDTIGFLRPRFEEGSLLPTRELVIAPYPNIEAGDRTDDLLCHFPTGIIPNPDVTDLVRLLNSPSEAAQ